VTALGGSTRIWTEQGWCWASELEAGQRVLCLHGDGHLAMTGISSVELCGEQDTVEVLTEVGDLVVPAGEPILTTGGPVLGSELVSITRRASVKVEVVQPRGIAEAGGCRAATGAAAAMVALAWLERSWTATPATLPAARRAYLDRLVAASGLKWAGTSDDRWHSWSWQMPADIDRGLRPTAEAMLALTAWTADQSRTVLDDRRIRSALLMAIVLEGDQPRLAWTPGYAPVECRITVHPTAMPFAKLVRASAGSDKVVKINLARPGAIVASQLAVGRLG
jgi:hypothetical protein